MTMINKLLKIGGHKKMTWEIIKAWLAIQGIKIVVSLAVLSFVVYLLA